MTRVIGWFGLFVLLALAAAPAADAVCTCGTLGTCSSAIACDGAFPGDDCRPPRRGTCKIVQGNANLGTCCCGCTRGPGRISCLYSPVAEDLAVLNDAVCVSAADAARPATLPKTGCVCESKKLDKKTAKTVKKAGKMLTKADAACGKGKDPAKKVKMAERHLGKLDRQVEKLADKGQVTEECRQKIKDLVGTLGIRIADAGQGGTLGSTTTTTLAGGTTTTTTVPSGPTCTPTFHTTLDPNEYDFQFTCNTASGPLDGFAIRVSAGFQLTNDLPPTGFACQRKTQVNPNDWYWCTGNFNYGDTITGGRIETTPAPTGPGFSATLVVTEMGGGNVGPFNFTVVP